ncbi:MAG: hypothetical protein KDN22_31565 [Verrucomicrobiae bacterium]|nr:hypothetical protein [Verrucomicrobiae bacterium]
MKQSLDPKPIVDAISEMEMSSIRSKLVAEIAGKWAEEEPHAAAVWIDSIPMENAKTRLMAKSEVAEEWFRYSPDDMLEIGAWFLTGAPEDMCDDLADAIAQEIAKRQSKGAQ